MHAFVALVGSVFWGSLAQADPRVWLEYSDAPEALMVANDSGTALRGCKVQWEVRFEGGLHYTEIAMVDLPAMGEQRVSDCADWWDENRSKSLDVHLTLYAPDGKELARQSYEGVFRAVPREGIVPTGWTATASRGSNPAAAFDGNPSTRWDTGGSQRPGDFYLLDMKQEHRIVGVILDARGSPEDYPSGLRIEVSVQGGPWKRVAEVTDTQPLNRRGRIKILFEPVEAQHVLITLTRPHGEHWFWSIHELSVLPVPSPESAQAQASGAQGAPEASGAAGILASTLPNSEGGQTAPQASQQQRTVLLFSATRGFRHSTCSYGKPVITHLGVASGLFRTICTEDPRFITDRFLAGIDCVILNNATGSYLNDEQRAALVRFVESGRGLLGIHAATDALYDWPQWPRLMGGWFDGHPWNEEVTIDVEIPEHPACEGVPNPWKIADEIYQHRDWSRSDVCVLMSLNTEQTNMTRPGIKRADWDFGIAWCKRVGKGRSFYTALGHRNEVMDDPIYQKHLIGALRWVMGMAEGPSEPHAKPR